MDDKVKRKYWLRVLLFGFIIYAATVITLILTGNINLFPSIVLIGNFLVPVAFVSFFYERREMFSVNMPATAMCFFFGGALGTIAASLLEPIFIPELTFITAFTVGIIEEFTKLIGVFLIARHRRYNSMLDGIILGSAAGMGFAAFESTGYAFTSFLQSGGSLSQTVFVTLMRGIASPVGHGTWTAILSSILLRESVQGRFHINIHVIKAYITVVVLHGLWDGFPLVINYIFPWAYSVLIGQLILGTVGLFILYRRWQDSKLEFSHKSAS
ncbi:PrsW family intramembrane metalloprotease [Ruminiclostridium cellobioparum]|uniref:PrsW family intramembrane metalloprotease n=1 Tax=Ruminiclostridium cellobioparum TaxID=29355 RepID=UPI0028A6405A|nr:PrsW family intramembrane metalloprotease [Ruminiclostridium cellobioparum]